MPLSLFIAFGTTGHADARLDERALARVLAMVRAIPSLVRADVFTPATAHDPYLDDGASPPLGLQLDFASLVDLEQACGKESHLQQLADPAFLPALRGIPFTQQAMATRRWPGPDPVFRNAPGTPHCTYLVDYPGPAEDTVAWISHYVTSHGAVMARFPGVREIEIATRIDWVSALPFPRANSMLKNRVTFDSPEALTAALNSPVRDEMRADFRTFPRFEGGNTHYPMATRTILPA